MNRELLRTLLEERQVLQNLAPRTQQVVDYLDGQFLGVPPQLRQTGLAYICWMSAGDPSKVAHALGLPLSEVERTVSLRPLPAEVTVIERMVDLLPKPIREATLLPNSKMNTKGNRPEITQRGQTIEEQRAQGQSVSTICEQLCITKGQYKYALKTQT